MYICRHDVLVPVWARRGGRTAGAGAGTRQNKYRGAFGGRARTGSPPPGAGTRHTIHTHATSTRGGPELLRRLPSFARLDDFDNKTQIVTALPPTVVPQNFVESLIIMRIT